MSRVSKDRVKLVMGRPDLRRSDWPREVPDLFFLGVVMFEHCNYRDLSVSTPIGCEGALFGGIGCASLIRWMCPAAQMATATLPAVNASEGQTRATSTRPRNRPMTRSNSPGGGSGSVITLGADNTIASFDLRTASAIASSVRCAYR